MVETASQPAAESWTNWSGAITSTPRRIVRPRSEDELAAAVAESSRRGETVRVAGSGHSFVPLCDASGGTLVSLENLTGVVAVDAAAGEATVWAGLAHLRARRAAACRGSRDDDHGRHRSPGDRRRDRDRDARHRLERAEHLEPGGGSADRDRGRRRARVGPRARRRRDARGPRFAGGARRRVAGSAETGTRVPAARAHLVRSAGRVHGAPRGAHPRHAPLRVLLDAGRRTPAS